MPTVFRHTLEKEDALKEGQSGSTPSDRRTSLTPLTAFALHPRKIRFETQEKEEQVILLLRQHGIVLFPSFLLIILLLCIPLIVVPLFFQNIQLPVIIPYQYIVVGTVFWYVMTFGVALMSFLRWYFNIYIVTDRRIVDIDFVHLLYKEFSEARLDKIQDINYRSGGIVATLCNYGDVFVETAGETPNIDFLSVPMPAKVIETIGSLLDKRRRRPSA